MGSSRYFYGEDFLFSLWRAAGFINARLACRKSMADNAARIFNLALYQAENKAKSDSATKIGAKAESARKTVCWDIDFS